MSDVNWWLMALSFLLGLVLTWILAVERVKPEPQIEPKPEPKVEPE